MTRPPFLGESLRRDLTEAVGPAQVLTEPDLTASYTRDWTGRFRGATPAVVRPADVNEVAAVVAVARRHDVALVPQGGRTGLVGGSVPLAGELLVSLTRLDQSIEVDERTGQATVGAAASLEALQAAAHVHGWAYGVDLAARGSARVGGTIATNAGGLRVLRHGDTRRQLRGVEVVLGDGSVVAHLGGLEKDNTGYDLAGLLCGSEGTLGIITRARLALVAPARERVVALCGFTSGRHAIEAAWQVRRHLPELSAAELFYAAGLDLVCSMLDLPHPLRDAAAAYVLFEATANTDPTEPLAGMVGDQAGVLDVAVASDATGMAALWDYRERHTEAINHLGPPAKLDVTLPAGELAGFAEEVGALVATVAPEARTWLFGHAADGNLHVNVTGVAPGDELVDDVVLTRVAELGGSISAEHGIGTAKRRWLHLVRTPAEIAAFRAVKAALDPDGVLNPGVLLPD